MNIPTHHLSVRVPWHDSGWNGKICCDPRENGSCMFLPRIHEAKDVAYEESIAGQWIHEIEDKSKLPPCVGEKIHFMSPHKIYKKVNHPYAGNNNNEQFYGHYKETTYCYPGYSFSAIPYNWMLKDSKTNLSTKASALGLDYDAAKEPALSFENSWVQQIDNQETLLNAFIEPIRPYESLVFIYAKNVPHIDKTCRVLIGVGKITKIGALTEYDYDRTKPVTFRSTLWERPVFHSIRDDHQEGFLLPYQEFFKLAETDDSITIADYVAHAPSFEEFSYGAEWVSNDSAIESLLILAEKLKKFQQILPDKNYEIQLKWIDNEISRLWKLRGPFPGLGSVLSGLNIEQGNFIAWELDKIVRDQDNREVVENPWDYVQRLMDGEYSFLPEGFKVKISDTVKATWKNYSDGEKAFFQLLSRMNVNNDQVKEVIDEKEKILLAYLENPYLLFENTRLNWLNITVSTIDKAVFSDEKILSQFPLSDETNIVSGIDQKRLRAVCTQILEDAALEGHTLLTDSQIVTKANELPIQPTCNPSIRNLAAIEDFLADEVIRLVLDVEDEIFYFKLTRLETIKNKIRRFIQRRSKRSIKPRIIENWSEIIKERFGVVDDSKPQWFKEKDDSAQKEKAEALDILINNKISVLIGPAGTGKTTLLKLLCDQPVINSGSILRLAPTGKARVNMGKDAKTLAQFLIKADRYNPDTGQYYTNPDAESYSYNTVIVDESSMLTEEQLAALIDSLTGVERFILVGDHRQLPPIGAGRPFVDIIKYLREQNKGIAELKVIFRQSNEEDLPEIEEDRLDVRLSKWFSDDSIKKDDFDIFKEIAEQPTKNFGAIKFVEWHSVKHLEEILFDVIDAEIKLLLEKNPDKVIRNPEANFSASLGANYYIEKSNWSGFGIESANEIESWQILSPMKTSGFGTKALNQIIQKKYRSKTKEKAIFPGSFEVDGNKIYKRRKMPKPIGDDNLVFGDKVINTKNTWWKKPWQKIFNPNDIADENILKYIANGEIGLHIGKYGKWDYDSPRPVNIVFSTQSDYAYVFKELDFNEDGEAKMELAYSITVHKSQGSGFDTVLFILSNPCPILSRELFYTALTRQKERIIILHQGDFKDFKKFTSGEFSETGRRLTDLFEEPKLKLVNKKFYDTKYIQVSAKGEFMISKSEVIIADQLYYKKIKYAYEAPISDDSGITIHPDFTIEDMDADIIYYWEHLGMLTKDDYRSKWKRKKEWYEKNGILSYSENNDADKQLIITRDKPDGGIDSLEIKEIIEELFE